MKKYQFIGKWTRIEDVVPIKNGDIICHCYASLPVGNIYTSVPGNSGDLFGMVSEFT